MMKKITVGVGIAVGILLMLLAISSYGQENKNTKSMKLNAGIVTPKLQESKVFYTTILNFGIVFENEFYILMHTPNHQAEVSFLLPDHPSQQHIFQAAYPGRGVYFTIEVDDVDDEYKRIKELGIPIEVELRDEPWGDRHFVIQDPNGIGLDIVTYQSVSQH